ncbi:hypothetical protein ACPV4I_03935, partial [Photobacterium damselae]
MDTEKEMQLDGVDRFSRYLVQSKLIAENEDVAESIANQLLKDKKKSELSQDEVIELINRYVLDNPSKVSEELQKHGLYDKQIELLANNQDTIDPTQRLYNVFDAILPKYVAEDSKNGNVELGRLTSVQPTEASPNLIANAISKALHTTVIPTAITGGAMMVVGGAALPVVYAAMIHKATMTLVAPTVMKAAIKYFGENASNEHCARLGSFVSKNTRMIAHTLSTRLGITKVSNALSNTNNPVFKALKNFKTKHPQIVKYSIMAATASLGVAYSTNVMAAAEHIPTTELSTDALHAIGNNDIPVEPSFFDRAFDKIKNTYDDLKNGIIGEDVDNPTSTFHDTPLHESTPPVSDIEPTAQQPESVKPENFQQPESVKPDNIPQPEGSIPSTVPNFNSYSEIKLPHLKGGLTELIKNEFLKNHIDFGNSADREKAIEHILGEIKSHNPHIENLDKVFVGDTITIPNVHGMTAANLVDISNHYSDHINIYDHSSYVNAEPAKPESVAPEQPQPVNVEPAKPESVVPEQPQPVN